MTAVSEKPCGESTKDQWRSTSSDKAEEILQLYLTGKHADCLFEIQIGTKEVMVNNLIIF